jgi:hypothetical protein
MDRHSKRRRWYWWLLAFLLVAAVCYRIYDLLPGSPASKNLEPRWDEEPQGEGRPSRDLDGDLTVMWRTVPLAGETWEVSPVSGINAAGRVFATVDLKGKTREEAEQAIRYDPRPRYGYHRPFWPVKKGTWFLRFDCGNFGWQFDITFDDQKRVKAVERRWIHWPADGQLRVSAEDSRRLHRVCTRGLPHAGLCAGPEVPRHLTAACQAGRHPRAAEAVGGARAAATRQGNRIEPACGTGRQRNIVSVR